MKKLTQNQWHFIEYIVSGCMWIVFGLMHVISTDSIPFLVGKVAFYLLFVICAAFELFIIVRSHYEESDEMSETHLMKAQATSYNGISIIIIFWMLLNSLDGVVPAFASIRVTDVLPFIAGIGKLIVGCKYINLEKNGDMLD